MAVYLSRFGKYFVNHLEETMLHGDWREMNEVFCSGGTKRRICARRHSVERMENSARLRVGGQLRQLLGLLRNAQPREHSSAVIRGHLRNAFVKRMSCNVMARDFDWNVGMLLGLCNSTLVETLHVFFLHEECLTLLGLFGEGLVVRKVQKLILTVPDPLLKTLIEHHDFFGRTSIQQLKELALRILRLNAPLEPFWLPALYELSGCRRYTIRYEQGQGAHDAVHATRISSALRAMLEDFENTGREIAVGHFSLISFVSTLSLVGNREPAYEGIPVAHISTMDFERWNVYYYKTADRERYLTLFVPRHRQPRGFLVHIKPGKIMDFL